MLASSALVLLMTPGLAFFYGGNGARQGVLNMIMMSVSAMGVVYGAVGALRLLDVRSATTSGASSVTRASTSASRV